MKKYTPTIILGFLALGFAYIASVFGVDTILSLGSHATISEYVHEWIQNDNNLEILSSAFIAVIGGLGYLMYHFITFTPKK